MKRAKGSTAFPRFFGGGTIGTLFAFFSQLEQEEKKEMSCHETPKLTTGIYGTHRVSNFYPCQRSQYLRRRLGLPSSKERG